MKFLKRLWQYFKKYKLLIVLSFIFSLIVAATSGGIAYIVKPTLDGIFINKNEDKLILMPFVIVGIYLVKGTFRFLQNYLMKKVGQLGVAEIRNDLYAKIIKLPLNFFGKSSTGTLMSRITNDVNLMQNAVSHVVTGIRECFTIIGLAAVVLYQDAYLGSFALFVLPLIVIPIVLILSLIHI